MLLTLRCKTTMWSIAGVSPATLPGSANRTVRSEEGRIRADGVTST